VDEALLECEAGKREAGAHVGTFRVWNPRNELRYAEHLPSNLLPSRSTSVALRVSTMSAECRTIKGVVRKRVVGGDEDAVLGGEIRGGSGTG